MSDRVVVYSATSDSEAAGSVAARLRARGVEIVEEQPKMLLVSGATDAISHVVGGARGWNVSAETKVPPPSTRKSVLKPPSK